MAKGNGYKDLKRSPLQGSLKRANGEPKTYLLGRMVELPGPSGVVDDEVSQDGGERGVLGGRTRGVEEGGEEEVKNGKYEFEGGGREKSAMAAAVER
ncbi:hypothetical protein TWF281_008359 [Arthrobotrys megalospora]